MLFSEAWRWHSDSVIHAAVSVSDLLVLQPLAVPTLEDLENSSRAAGKNFNGHVVSRRSTCQPPSRGNDRRPGHCQGRPATSAGAGYGGPGGVGGAAAGGRGWRTATSWRECHRQLTPRHRKAAIACPGRAWGQRRTAQTSCSKRSTPGKSAPSCSRRHRRARISRIGRQPLPESRRLRAQGLLGGFARQHDR